MKAHWIGKKSLNYEQRKINRDRNPYSATSSILSVKTNRVDSMELALGTISTMDSLSFCNHTPNHFLETFITKIMSKTVSYLIKAFKKANKEARKRILARAGFSSDNEYFGYLSSGGNVTRDGGGTTRKRKKKEKLAVVHNVHVLDRSGSMSGLKLQNAIAGINAEVELLKQDKTVKYTHTLVYFDDVVVHHCVMVPIENVENFNIRSGGSTALYDAMGETINTLRERKDRDDKVIVKIFTDGQENRSRKFGAREIQKLIKDVEDEGITVAFSGTEKDVVFVTRNLNVDFSNSLVHDNTHEGIKASYARSASATMEYAKKVSLKQNVKRGFYKSIK